MLMSYLLQLLGLWFLSMAMIKHFRYTFSFQLTKTMENIFTISGYIFLMLSLFLTCLLTPLPIKLVYWVGYLAFNIMLVSLLNSFNEARHKRAKQTK